MVSVEKGKRNKGDGGSWFWSGKRKLPHCEEHFGACKALIKSPMAKTLPVDSSLSVMEMFVLHSLPFTWVEMKCVALVYHNNDKISNIGKSVDYWNNNISSLINSIEKWILAKRTSCSCFGKPPLSLCLVFMVVLVAGEGELVIYWPLGCLSLAALVF